MTANIFCDFANKEIRRVFGLYNNLAAQDHERVLTTWLRIAVLLSTDWALIPMGFVAESRILQKILTANEELLMARVVRLSIRDTQIDLFIERRRNEYRPYISDYAPLFEDKTIDFLRRYAVAIHERVGNTAQRIGGNWPIALEAKPSLALIREELSGSDWDTILQLPRQISEEGLGFTWNAITDRLPRMRSSSAEILRRFLHGDFVRGYLIEYDLKILTNLPYGWRDLGIQARGGFSDYDRFEACLQPLGVLDFILGLDSASLLALRREPGFIQFQDLYSTLSSSPASTQQLRFAFSEAASRLSKFQSSFLKTIGEKEDTCAVSLGGEAIPLLASYLVQAADRAVDRIAPARAISPMPSSPRVYLEDIEELRAAGQISAADTLKFLKNGRIDVSEDDVQSALEQFLSVPFHRKDWGGEINDLYTSNIHLKGHRLSVAFLLKGRGLRTPEMRIADCGKNGDQLLRLIESPAKLFVVQYVGPVSDAVIKDIDGKIRGMRLAGEQVYYCIIDGQETVKILLASGKLN